MPQTSPQPHEGVSPDVDPHLDQLSHGSTGHESVPTGGDGSWQLQAQTERLAAQNGIDLIKQVAAMGANLPENDNTLTPYHAADVARRQLIKLYDFLGTGNYDNETLNEALQAVDSFDQQAAEKDYGFVGSLLPLHNIPAERMQPLFLDQQSILHELLARKAQMVSQQGVEELDEFVQTLEYVVGTTYRKPSRDNWHRNGKLRKQLPDYFEQVTSHEKFVPICIDKAIERSEQYKHRGKANRELQDFEGYCLRHILGLPADISFDMQLAHVKRGLKRDKHGDPLPYDEHGVDLDHYRKFLATTVDQIRALGQGNALRLNKELGIINFDDYEQHHLQTMLAMISSNPELVQKAQANDVTLVIQNAFETFPYELSKVSHAVDPESVLVGGEISASSGQEAIEQITQLLAKVGIYLQASPANLIISTHGLPEGLAFNYHEATVLQKANATQQDLAELGRRLGELMQPGKQSGQRQVALLACSQAKKPELRGLARMQNIAGRLAHFFGVKQQRPVDDLAPAAALASGTSPEDRVTVTAAKKIIKVGKHDKGLVFKVGRNKVLPASTYQLNQRGKIKEGKTQYIDFKDRAA